MADPVTTTNEPEHDLEVQVHVTPTYAPCDHEWNDDCEEPEFCIKCGMSFIRHIFTECP